MPFHTSLSIVPLSKVCLFNLLFPCSANYLKCFLGWLLSDFICTIRCHNLWVTISSSTLYSLSTLEFSTVFFPILNKMYFLTPVTFKLHRWLRGILSILLANHILLPKDTPNFSATFILRPGNFEIALMKIRERINNWTGLRIAELVMVNPTFCNIFQMKSLCNNGHIQD